MYLALQLGAIALFCTSNNVNKYFHCAARGSVGHKINNCQRFFVCCSITIYYYNYCASAVVVAGIYSPSACLINFTVRLFLAFGFVSQLFGAAAHKYLMQNN